MLRQMNKGEEKMERVNQTGMVWRKEDRCYKNTLANTCAAYMPRIRPFNIQSESVFH